MPIYTTNEGKTIELGDLLGEGGEGAVYKIRKSRSVQYLRQLNVA